MSKLIDEAKYETLCRIREYGSVTSDDLDECLAPLVERIAALEADIEWRKEQFYTLSECVGKNTEAAECVEMIGQLCECKAVGRVGWIEITPYPSGVEITVWANAYGVVKSGNTLHAALKAVVEAQEQRDE